MIVDAAAFSTKGIREHNEDSYLLDSIVGGTGIEDSIDILTQNKGKHIFAVADGMGGHAAGDVASNFILTELRQLNEINSKIDADFFNEKMPLIHNKLLEKGKNDKTQNMGSTFVCLVINDNESGFCNIGDSRLYRFRNGFVQQISHDDSLSELIENAPKNIVTNAMGAGLSDIEIETRFSASFAVAGDVFVLCSDGVHGYISDEEIEQIISQDFSLVEKARQIVEKALNNGSDDNSTAIIVNIK